MTAFEEDGITAKILWQHAGLERDVPGNVTTIAVAPAPAGAAPEIAFAQQARLWVVAEFDIFGGQIGERVCFEAPAHVEHWLLAKAIAALRRHDPDHERRLDSLGPTLVRDSE